MTPIQEVQIAQHVVYEGIVGLTWIKADRIISFDRRKLAIRPLGRLFDYHPKANF